MGHLRIGIGCYGEFHNARRSWSCLYTVILIRMFSVLVFIEVENLCWPSQLSTIMYFILSCLSAFFENWGGIYLRSSELQLLHSTIMDEP